MDNIKRHIVIASHSTLAQGMANALKFFEGDNLKLTVLSAYVDNKPIEGQIEEIFDQFDKEDEVIVLTDLWVVQLIKNFSRILTDRILI